MIRQCVNYMNCGNMQYARRGIPASSWCKPCREGLSQVDKLYMIAFTDVWKLRTDHTDEEKEAVEMGIADRKGIEPE